MSRPADCWPGATWYEVEGQGADWPRLEGLQRCRVAIIGGGLAGISTALGLIERGLESVAVLDSHGPGAGASGRNGGFVFAGYSLGNDALIDQIGEDDARRLHGYTRAGVKLVRERIDRYAIDCQVNDAGVLLADWFGEPEALQAAAERMRRRLGFEQEWISPRRMSDWVDSARYGGGLLEPGSFHFHPLRYIRGLAGRIEDAGGRVFGNSGVRSIARCGRHWRLETCRGRLEAQQVVLATGGYDRRLLRSIQRALQPVATYIVVTEPLGERLQRRLPRPVAVYDTRFAFDYYRPLPDTRLLWGGRISMARRSPAAIRRLMRRDLARVFPDFAQARLDYAWGGWMSYARHEMPLLGRNPEGIWYALAFGGHGMATTTLAGEIMAEALCGDGRRLAEFERWPPVWAGGLLGRAVGQGMYWRAQLRDRWRERKTAV